MISRRIADTLPVMPKIWYIPVQDPMAQAMIMYVARFVIFSFSDILITEAPANTGNRSSTLTITMFLSAGRDVKPDIWIHTDRMLCAVLGLLRRWYWDFLWGRIAFLFTGWDLAWGRPRKSHPFLRCISLDNSTWIKASEIIRLPRTVWKMKAFKVSYAYRGLWCSFYYSLQWFSYTERAPSSAKPHSAVSNYEFYES